MTITKQPLVSILLPVKNCGAFLQEAVESVLGQTYKRLELIIVDDHSIDGSVPELDQNDPRLKIIDNRGAGLIDALNCAANHAQGEYLARMDGDDVCLPHRIEKQVAMMEADKQLGIVATEVEVFSSSGVMDGYKIYQEWVNAIVTHEQIVNNIFVESPLPHPTVMFRRSVFDELGGYQDNGWAEDFDLWLRAFEAGVRMGKVTEVLLRWRDEPGRTTKTNERYSKDSFMRARAHYLARTVLKSRSAIIWGAGNAGKMLCRYLEREGASVTGFIDINPRKIGNEKAGRPVYGKSIIAKALDALVIICVAARGARNEIREQMDGAGKKEGEDYVSVV